MYVFSFFFFKQKTAYEMRISDWSSDVCSSDLLRFHRPTQRRDERTRRLDEPPALDAGGLPDWPERPCAAKDPVQLRRVGVGVLLAADHRRDQIGRASCRERVCQYV